MKAQGEGEAVSKTTVFNIDLARLLEYLKNRDLTQARFRTMSGTLPPPAAMSGPALAERFNGLIYVARTNRFPFNPNQALTARAFDPADAWPNTAAWDPNPRDAGGANPWSFNPDNLGLQYPNVGTQVGTDGAVILGNGRFGLTNINWIAPGLDRGGVPRLNPYPNLVVRPVRPQNFHHGVMISNAKSIKRQLAGVPNFGSQGVNIVTPNALYLNGDFNAVADLVNIGTDEPVMKLSNSGVAADSINLLSNGWTTRNLPLMKSPSILNAPLIAVAEDTTYNAGITTHNQPTTIQRVIEGQGAAFIDTMLFMENWGERTMNFTGSLTVLDSRRYTEQFLLDGIKASGRNPLGYQGANYLTWPTDRGGPPPLARLFDAQDANQLADLPRTTVSTPQVYRPPTRVFNYQTDFANKEGTPPFAPFGMISTGIGGWVRVLE